MTLPLIDMTSNTTSRLFNDSCATAELTQSIAWGATGATSNPVISLTVLRTEWETWRPRVELLVAEQPTANEQVIAWQVYKELSQAGAKLLEPTHVATGHTWGRLSVQTDPTLHNHTAAMLEQAGELAALGPNMQVKVPATAAGIAMVEEATYRGINLNVTVSFTVAQVLAIGESIEAGLRRREADGLDISHMAPVATMMVGRLDDWCKVVAARESLDIAPETLDWAGIAAFKNAHGIYTERGYRTRLLVAAYRHLGHWSELIGGADDAPTVMTMPFEWQVKANNSGLPATPRLSEPVDPEILAALKTMPEFVKGYEADGITIEDFDSYGAVRRTLRSFIAAWYDVVAIVRDVMIPNPD